MITEILIPSAYSQDSAAQGEEFSFASFVPLLLIFGIFYFLIIRPQSNKMKEHQELIKNLKKGDEVITNGGIVGKIFDIDDKKGQVEVEVGDGVYIRLLKNYISQKVITEKTNKPIHKSGKDNKSKISKK